MYARNYTAREITLFGTNAKLNHFCISCSSVYQSKPEAYMLDGVDAQTSTMARPMFLCTCFPLYVWPTNRCGWGMRPLVLKVAIVALAIIFISCRNVQLKVRVCYLLGFCEIVTLVTVQDNLCVIAMYRKWFTGKKVPKMLLG